MAADSAGAQSQPQKAEVNYELALRAAASDLLQRAGLAAYLGKTFHGTNGVAQRDLVAALGYKETLTAGDYRVRYERGGIAERIVEAAPKATWSDLPDIQETQDPDDSTPFEEAFRELAQRLSLWERLLSADVLAGLGNYAVLVIGAEGDLARPLGRISDPRRILYVQPLAEDRASVKDLVEKSDDPRFGQPETYNCRFSSKQEKAVHWSRVIHVAEGLLEDRINGKPRLRGVWNYLDDLDKLVGGGAEAAWRKMDPGTQFDVEPGPPGPDGRPVNRLTAEVQAALEDQIEEMRHGLRRDLQTSGVKINPLASQVAAFGPNASKVIDLIAGTTGIPQRILLGAEAGELASSQDETNWQKQIDQRRRWFAEPLVRAFVDRLIGAGALPEPAEYQVMWPEVETLTETDKAKAAESAARANQAQSNAGGGIVLTNDEIRDRVYGLPPLEGEGVVTVEPGSEEDGDELRSAVEDGPDEPEWRAVHRAADANLSRVASAFDSMWSDAADRVDRKALAHALDFEDREEAIREVVRALESAEVAALPRITDSLAGTLGDGADATLRAAKRRGSFLRSASLADVPLRGAAEPNEGIEIRPFDPSGFDFNRANPRAVEYAAKRAAALISEIGDKTKAAVRLLIEQAFVEGISPARLQALIRKRVGLRADQLEAIANFVAEIRSAEAGTLITRFPPAPTLRDVPGLRFRVPDKVTSEWLARKVDLYESMQRKLRATTIARTETIRSANEGTRQTWLQARDQGLLPADQKRVWITTRDGAERPEHRAAHGQVRGIEEPFDVGDGSTEPGTDPNCRCAQGLATAEDLQRSNA